VVLIALATVVGVTGCTAREAPSKPTVLRVVMTELPAGVRGNVHVTGEGLDRRVSATTDLRDVAPGRYTLEVEPVRVSDDATSHPVTERIAVRVPRNTTTVANARYGIVVPDTTKVLDADNLGLVSDVAGPVLVFAKEAPLVSSFEPGQVLVSGVGPSTPQGLLRKVVAVSRGPSGIEVRTEPATLPDAVPVGELSVDKDDFGDATLPNLRRGTAMTGTINVGFPLDKANVAEGGCGGPLSGDVGLSWRPRIQLHWNWQKLLGVPLRIKGAKFVVDADHLLTARYAKTVAAACSLEVVKPDLPFVVTTFTVPVGPVPVVVSITLQALLKAELGGEISTDYTLTTGEQALVGLEYRGGRVKPIVRVSKPKQVADLTANLDASVKIGLRTTLAIYGVTGPYLDLTAGARARAAASTDGGTVGCVGLYGDIGWQFGRTGVSVEKSDVVALEAQVYPRLSTGCPLAEEPVDARKVSPHRKKVTIEDYRWMIGTWERDIEDPSGNKDSLLKEVLTVAPDGRVTITRQFYLDIGYQEPIRCEGVLAYSDTGVLVVDTSPGPAEYLDVCHTALDDHEIAYVTPEETGDKERLDWFGPVAGIRGFDRVS
jgi:hypothetical protein